MISSDTLPETTHNGMDEFNEAILAFALATAAALFIKAPALFGFDLDQNESFYIRNMSFFVLPLLTGYFVWKRRLDTRTTLFWLAAAFVAAALFANAYSFAPGGDTEVLTALHLPIALWLIVGIAYAGGSWSQVGGCGSALGHLRAYH